MYFIANQAIIDGESPGQINKNELSKIGESYNKMLEDENPDSNCGSN